ILLKLKIKKALQIHFNYCFLIFFIRNQLVEQFRCLEQQSDSRLQLLQDLQEFFRRKAELQLEYSRGLDKLAERYSSKIRTSREHHYFKKDQNLLSTVNCWYLVLEQTRRESRDHATLSDIYNNNVIVRLAHVGEDVMRLFKKSKDIGVQMHEELVKVTTELYTVMKTYHMYHTESLSAESKLKEAEKQEEKHIGKSNDISAGLLRYGHDERPQRRSSVKKMEKLKEKRQAKYHENKLKCTKARNDYLLNLAATNALVAKYYIHDVSDMIDCCDMGYHASLARTMRTYLSAEYSLETSRHEGLDLLEGAVDAMDVRGDKLKFMDTHSQMFCPPTRFDYQPHMGDEVSAQQPVQTELLMRYHQLQSRLATLKIENEEVRKTLDATMQTLQDMLTVEDFDVSDAFQHSQSTESVKSASSDSYMSKANITKRRANQQETEGFYFTKYKEYLNGSNLIVKLQAKHDLLKQTLGEGESYFNSHSSTHLLCDSGQAIPVVVESCIRYINLYGLQQQGIFRVPGSQVEVNDIKNAFERGEDPLEDDQTDHDINSVAGVLKLYFRGLENPLFPKERFLDLISTTKLDSGAERAHHLQQITATLQRPVIVVMRYLFAFLNHLSQYSDENMMDYYNLAICFGPTLMPIPDDQDPVSCQAHVNEVIKSFIIHHEAIFPTQRELEGPVYEKCMTGGEEYWNAADSLSPTRADQPPRVLPRPCSPHKIAVSRGLTDSPEKRHLTTFGRKALIDSHSQRSSPSATRHGSLGDHKTLEAEALAEDIEKTMNTALHELRELERQNVAKHAPDVVLDTLEPMKHPCGAHQEASSSPLHTMVIRDPEAAQRRSNSCSSSETMTTFKPALTTRRPSAPLRPPPVRPVRPAPVIGQGPHRSSSSSSSGLGSPSITPTDRVFPKAPSPSPSTSSSSSDKQGNM
uniref:SLIT-ROBO Rho GTPase-activating protein 3-like n=1 Tax=Gouania willdenowi TaxID=441366 RepID=A0A8C5GJB7_GOUWI